MAHTPHPSVRCWTSIEPSPAGGEGATTGVATRGYTVRAHLSFTFRRTGYTPTSAQSLSLDLPVHKRHHALEHVAGLRQVGRMAGVAVRVDIFQRDLAARLAIILD